MYNSILFKKKIYKLHFFQYLFVNRKTLKLGMCTVNYMSKHWFFRFLLTQRNTICIKYKHFMYTVDYGIKIKKIKILTS